jgi:uncharacterized membrane protein YkvA (DUF1232 family)
MFDYEKHKKHYSEAKFWDKVLKFAKKAGIKVVYNALLLFYTLQKPDVPPHIKGIIIGALGYFIFPVDIVPDIVPVVGYADDLSALLGALGLTALHIDSTTKDMAKQKLRDWFGDYDQSEVENDN